ncbi:NACHT domain-containing protein [Azospirillaceae bacterium]
MAVPEPPPPTGKYRFVTDGREGCLGKFREFLSAVQVADSPSELDATENVTKGYFRGKNPPRSFRALFDHIVKPEETEKNKKNKRPSKRHRTDEAATVLHLLKNFEMEFTASASHRSELIEKMLRPICPNLGDEVGKRLQLVGMLMNLLSNGEARLDVAGMDDLLRGAGLDPDRLRNLAKLNETLAVVLDDELQRIGYRTYADVRKSPEWSVEKSVLLITGESGEGKTWQLAKLARAEADVGRYIVWTFPEKNMNATSVVGKAMRVVWQQGLGATDEKTPTALTSHYRAMIASNAAMPWLTIAVDDVHDVDLARDLIRQPWQRWGMRLAMSVPTAVVPSVQQAGITVHKVGRFSVSEIDDLLERKGRNWGQLPSDLQQLLRTPILAGLYLQLPYETFKTAPSSEYEIFQRFWERMQEKTRTGDDGILISIAERVLNGGSYPIERGQWCEVNLDSDAVDKLRASGWLNCSSGGLVGFAHDRLLNWAAAEALAQQMTIGKLTTEQLAERLVQCADRYTKHFAKHLGYVPMDTLWLLAADNARTHELSNIIERLETCPQYGHGELYVLLATLGCCVVDALLDRLSRLPEGDYQVNFVALAFSSIVVQDGVDLSELVGQLLRSSSVNRQAVGIAAATAKPSKCFLDRLWTLHQERYVVSDCTAQERKTCRWNHQDYERSFAALRAGVELDPVWLRNQIKKASAQERVGELAYLLNNLEHPSAQDIWSEVKDDLMKKVPTNRPRSLLYCIGKFGDQSLLDFVLSCLSREEDLACSAAFANLIRLDPDTAVHRLGEFPRSKLVSCRNWWLPQLLHAKPKELRRKLLEIAGSDSKNYRLIDDLFTDRADELDTEMLSFRLRAFETELKDRLDETCQTDTWWLDYPLRLLGRITRLDLLHILWKEAGGPLESMVVDVACRRTERRTRDSDYSVLEGCRQFLIRVGGAGITRLVNHELRSSNFWGRYGGLEWAFVSPDEDTIALLTEIGRRPVLPDDKDKGDIESNGWQERYMVTIALAAAGSVEGVMDAIWGVGPEAVDVNLDRLIQPTPLDRMHTKRAADVLADFTATEEDVLKALTVALLSGDSDFIPSVRRHLTNANPSGKVAGIACITLHRLGDVSAEFRQLAFPMLKTKENGNCALGALLAMGETAVECLMYHLHNTPFSQWTNIETVLVANLYRYENSRKNVIQWAVRLCKESRDTEKLLEIAAEAADADIRELIIRKAFHENNVFVGETLRAIRALAKFDVKRAVLAVDRQLLRITKKCEKLWVFANLMTQLNSDDTILRLIEVARQCKESAAAIGCALRKLDSTKVDEALAACMIDPRRDIRAVGVELAGWLPPGRLDNQIKNMLAVEKESKLHNLSSNALYRKEQETIALDLLDAFEASSNNRRWSLLSALLNVADPYLLTDPDDALWIGRALNKAPYIFNLHAWKTIEKRKSELIS